MAKMYPPEISESVKSDAETSLFKRFKEQLPDGFIVMHSVGCLIRDPQRFDLDKEIDFLIIHPKLGLLVLEVKGGRIEVDGGRWYSIDRYNVRHELPRSPFEQARNNLHALRDKIAQTPATRPFQDAYRLQRGVAFPSVNIGREDFGIDAPRDIIIDSSDLYSLELAVRRIMGSPSNQDPLSDDAIRVLVDLLKPTRQIHRPGLGYQLQSADDDIIRLTEEQYEIVDTLQFQRRALIHGCAGSGKTMLAMEKARRLAAEGFRVLFTCYNVSLGDWVREQFCQDQHPSIRNIDVAQYHKLAHDFCSRAGVVVPREPSEDLDHYFSVVMPEALQEALDSLSDRFDAIIVDEGQDFKDLWWLTLIELLKDRDHGIFYIFYDDNQRIYQRENNFPFNEPQFPLYKNCRNTDRIHRRVVRYHKGTPKPRSSGLEGPEPEIVPVENGNRIETLRKVFTRLFTEEHIPADQVVILTPRSGTSDFKRGTKIGTKTLTWNKRSGANEVRVCSIHSFKGLESPVVILAELDRFHPESPQDELLYVATSRAQSHLIVLGELPEPVIQAQLSSSAESDLAGNAEGIAEDIELDLDIAAEPVVQPVPNDEIAPVVASEVAVEPSAESEVVEVVPASRSDVIGDPAALTEADEAAAVLVTSSVPGSVTQPDIPFESTELRPSPPSFRIGRGAGGEGPIPEPLALPASANGASPTQESANRAVNERPRTVSQSVPGILRPSWTGQADDPRHWSAPVERDQPRSSTRPPTNSPPSSGVGGVGKPPKTGDGESLPVNPPGNGWAVAGLLCGILALFIHVLAIAAIIVAGIGLLNTKEHGGRGKAAGWIGLTLGVIVVLGMLQ